jgi:hypothetical protein
MFILVFLLSITFLKTILTKHLLNIYYSIIISITIEKHILIQLKITNNNFFKKIIFCNHEI